jgi:ribonuclease HI
MIHIFVDGAFYQGRKRGGIGLRVHTTDAIYEIMRPSTAPTSQRVEHDAAQAALRWLQGRPLSEAATIWVDTQASLNRVRRRVSGGVRTVFVRLATGAANAGMKAAHNLAQLGADGYAEEAVYPVGTNSGQQFA